jgi:hypothetical protein
MTSNGRYVKTDNDDFMDEFTFFNILGVKVDWKGAIYNANFQRYEKVESDKGDRNQAETEKA